MDSDPEPGARFSEIVEPEVEKRAKLLMARGSAAAS